MRKPPEIPFEWNAYVTQSPWAMEVRSWCMYSTVEYVNQDMLDFFQGWENNHGMLWNPQSFLIQSIKIFGATSMELKSQLLLRIGNKICYDAPVWANCLRQSQILQIPVMIPPLTSYGARIQNIPFRFAEDVMKRPITVGFFGLLARPVQ